MISVQKSVAHPWMCDVLGHMTTRFYVGMFDDAAYHFLHTVFGWTGASDEAGKTAWVDAQHIIEYRSEVTAGGLLEINACLTKIGNSRKYCWIWQENELGLPPMEVEAAP